MKNDDNSASKSQLFKKNGESKTNGKAFGKWFEDSSDSEDQIMDSDEFGKLHRQLCKKTVEDIKDERKQIFSFLDELKADMVSHKAKIQK